jgi:2-methylcitrate dehydratase PrpD
MTTGPTAQVAAFIADCDPAAAGAAIFDQALKVVADTFAAILSGAGSEVAPPLLAYLDGLGAPGGVPVLGTARTASAEAAALVNGSFGAALDFDDVLSQMPGHPSAVVIPALCSALGWTGGPVAGRRFLEAYIVGVEVGAKIAVGIGLGHYKRGYHATGTLCVLSAVAGLARLLRLDPATTRTAIGIACSTSAGLQANFGTMTKPLHSGWAARSALAAVALARAGFTAAPNALEAPGGLFAAYGTPDSDAARTVAALGAPWTMLDPGIALKKFSCCYATHRAIDALQQIKVELGLAPAVLARLDCRVAPGALTPLPYPAPRTGLEAKFSMDYALAAGVLDDSFAIWTFTDAAARRPEIADLYARIHVAEDSGCVAGQPDWPSRSYGSRGVVRLEATTVDGRIAAREVAIAPGHPQRALGWDDLALKFQDCARSAGLPEQQAAAAFAGLQGLQGLPDVATLRDLMCLGPTAPDRAAAPTFGGIA